MANAKLSKSLGFAVTRHTEDKIHQVRQIYVYFVIFRDILNLSVILIHFLYRSHKHHVWAPCDVGVCAVAKLADCSQAALRARDSHLSKVFAAHLQYRNIWARLG